MQLLHEEANEVSFRLSYSSLHISSSVLIYLLLLCTKEVAHCISIDISSAVGRRSVFELRNRLRSKISDAYVAGVLNEDQFDRIIDEVIAPRIHVYGSTLRELLDKYKETPV